MSLTGQRVLVIGRGSGIARAIAEAAMAEGADVIAAGRNVESLRADYGSKASVLPVDLTDEKSVEALAAETGLIDHVVVTASARARGATVDLAPETVLLSLQTKVVGPLLVAKHFAGQVNAGGSMIFASGATGRRPAPTMTAVAATNGAVDALTRSLAVELAPIRVNAFSPGVVDSGAWDALGEAKAGFLAERAERNPARRIGSPADIASAVTFLMTNTFVTGTTLDIDGGETIA
jgi:NAD(P)-dependent dehydrogenase (short-subunit alcohol dehydrogenase family)